MPTFSSSTPLARSLVTRSRSVPGTGLARHDPHVTQLPRVFGVVLALVEALDQVLVASSGWVRTLCTRIRLS
jgi:hypothetical protein